MKVPLVDLRRDRTLDEALTAAFARVLESGRWVLGPEVDAFERACEERLQVAHALGVSSGTDALLLAMMALGIGPGDEVICPTFTFFATAAAIARVGATPVFADCEDESFGLDPHDVARRIGPRTKAIVVTHLFGRTVDLDALAGHGLPVIEDAAQAFGAPRAGAVGTLGCFSFFPTKNLGAMGDAGLLVTQDAALADKARLLRTHGASPKYHHQLVGGNFRIDALQAALLRVKLAHLERDVAARRANAARYRERLRDTKQVSTPTLEGDHTFHQFVIRVVDGSRDALRDHLERRGVATEIYYPLPMHRQPCFASLPAGSFPHAERAAREVLALPIFPGLTEVELDWVASSVAEYFR